MAESTVHTPHTRAQAFVDGVSASEDVRGSRKLVVTGGPSPVSGGFEVWVRLFDGGREVRIDPHRVFINPPLRVHGEERPDPVRVFWEIVWQSVTSTPHRRGWRRPRWQ